MFFLVLLAVIGAGTTGIALENLDDEEMMMQDATYAVDPEALREAAQSYHEAAEKPVILVIRRIEGGSPSYSRPTEEELQRLGLKKAKLLGDGTVCHSFACEPPSPFDPSSATSVSQRITTFCMQLNLVPPWETAGSGAAPGASTPLEGAGSGSNARAAPAESSLAARILAEESAENTEQQATTAGTTAVGSTAAAAAAEDAAAAELPSAQLHEEEASARARAEAAAAALVGAGIMSPSQAAAATDAAMAAAPSQEAAAAEEKAAAEQRAAAAEAGATASAPTTMGASADGSSGDSTTNSSSDGGTHDCATIACLSVSESLNPLLAARSEDDNTGSSHEQQSQLQRSPPPHGEQQQQLVVRNFEAEQQKILELEFRRELAAQEDAVPGLCLLCFDREPDAVFLGCGHGGVCYQCAMDTFVAHREVCPFCRGKVQQIVTIARKTAVHSSGLHTVQVTGPKRHPVMGALGLRF